MQRCQQTDRLYGSPGRRRTRLLVYPGNVTAKIPLHLVVTLKERSVVITLHGFGYDNEGIVLIANDNAFKGPKSEEPLWIRPSLDKKFYEVGAVNMETHKVFDLVVVYNSLCT